MEQANECAVKRAVGPATCFGGGQGDRPHQGHLPINLAHTLLVALQRLAGDIAHRRLSSHRRWGQGAVQSHFSRPQEPAQERLLTAVTWVKLNRMRQNTFAKPRAMQNQLARLFGSNFGLVSGEQLTAAELKKTLKAVVGELKEYVFANVDSDESHMMQIASALYAAEQATYADFLGWYRRTFPADYAAVFR